MYLNSNLIEAETYYLLDSSSIDRDFVFNSSLIDRDFRGLAKISNAKKLITYSFEARIKIRLNRYLKDIIGHILERFSERETLHLCV